MFFANGLKQAVKLCGNVRAAADLLDTLMPDAKCDPRAVDYALRSRGITVLYRMKSQGIHHPLLSLFEMAWLDVSIQFHSGQRLDMNTTTSEWPALRDRMVRFCGRPIFNDDVIDTELRELGATGVLRTAN
ncbi:MAG: hypothetical protein M5U26_09385 [Planctomycetota bacterium]|nr:hypothetical protein [Planctomycetota bacterium]